MLYSGSLFLSLKFKVKKLPVIEPLMKLTPNIKHKLTHQTLYLSFWKVDVNTPIINGVKISDIKNYPFPVPIKNFINDFINVGN